MWQDPDPDTLASLLQVLRASEMDL